MTKITVVALFDDESGGFGYQLDHLVGLHVVKIDRHVAANPVGDKDIEALLARQHLHDFTDIEFLDRQRNLAGMGGRRHGQEYKQHE